MASLSLPWLTAAVAAPFVGALWLARARLPHETRTRALAALLVSFACAGLAFLEVQGSPAVGLHRDPWDLGVALGVSPWLAVDRLNAPLLLFTTVLASVTVLVAPRRVCEPERLERLILVTGLQIATVATASLPVIAVLGLLTVAVAAASARARAPGLERVVLLYLGLGALLVVAGAVAQVTSEGQMPVWAWALLVVGLAARAGIFPLHGWIPAWFAHGGGFGMGMALGLPQVAAYTMLRFVVPLAPEGPLFGLTAAATATMLYASLLALVQKEARAAFGWLALGAAAQTLVGLESRTTLSLVGGLATWVSSGLSLLGFGLTLWVLESRRGPLRLDHFAGGFERTPALAVAFLVLGLASVGFPGTLGFVGEELLVHGTLEAHPLSAYGVLACTALNGITVVKAWSYLFCGARDPSVAMQMRPREQVGLVLLVVLVVAGGLWPGPMLRVNAGAVTELHLKVGAK